ncbi:hypothetical protein MHEC_28860 [Mycobacterium heckeshornense]|uniref:Mutator family transposase n=1 Tax=Mycobacterium heckeshornense TaxID=110505 RepID=A0A7R7JIC3_9MYCO|nr:hypothetical protein MHEC_28860 [Mycobacterium heckeshornense]
MVHVIRNAMRFVSYKDRRKVASSMRAIYSAPTVDAAELALKEFDRDFGAQYPGAIDVWRGAWPEFIAFLDYPVELRKIVYTTNAIVIWSPRSGVFDVRHEGLRSPVLRGGRGYLRSSRRQSLWRDDASCPGHLIGLVA